MVINIIAKIKKSIQRDIETRNKVTPFIIFVSFLLSFILTRLITVYNPYNTSLFIKDYHIHHFYSGIILLIISNWVAIFSNKEHNKKIAGFLLGAGLGILIDEFGLILTCTTLTKQCDYYARQSFDAFFIILSILLAILYSKPIIQKIKARLKKGKNTKDLYNKNTS